MYDCSRWYALEHLPRILRVQNFPGWLIRYHWVPLTLLGFVLPAVGGRPLVPWGIFLRVTLGLHAISGSSTLQPICGDPAQNLLAPAHYFALREAVTRTELTRRKSSALRCFQRGGNGMAMQFNRSSPPAGLGPFEGPTGDCGRSAGPMDAPQTSTAL
jgi:hypothetical protein